MSWKDNIEIKVDFDGKKNYFIASVNEDIGVVDYEVNMIENNPSLGNLNLIVSQFDDKIELMYDVSGKKTLSEIIKSRKLLKREFISLSRNILRNLSQFEELMLENGISVLDPDYLYVDENDFKVVVLYIPVVPREKIVVKDDLNSLLNKLYTENLELDEEGDIKIIDKLINDIKNEILDIPKLYKQIEYMVNNNGLSREDKKSVEQRPVIVERVIREVEEPVEIVKPIKKSKEGFKKNLFFITVFQILIVLVALAIFFVSGFDENKKIIFIVGILFLDMVVCFITLMFDRNNFEVKNKGAKKQKNEFLKSKKAVVSEGSYETVLLGNVELENKSKAYLVEKSNVGFEHKYLINKDKFKVGRLVGEVDLVVKNNAVGKVHCEIVRDKDKYYIMDYNSKNGTYLNSGRVTSGNSYELKNKDVVRLANSEYIFLVE